MITDTLPAFPPIMLRGLRYVEAIQQMRVTGCAIRRNHWCAPILINKGSRFFLDDEGELKPWKALAEDRRASDWEMVERPAPEAHQ